MILMFNSYFETGSYFGYMERIGKSLIQSFTTGKKKLLLSRIHIGWDVEAAKLARMMDQNRSGIY